MIMRGGYEWVCHQQWRPGQSADQFRHCLFVLYRIAQNVTPVQLFGYNCVTKLSWLVML